MICGLLITPFQTVLFLGFATLLILVLSILFPGQYCRSGKTRAVASIRHFARSRGGGVVAAVGAEVSYSP